jgi:hypothetical protein
MDNATFYAAAQHIILTLMEKHLLHLSQDELNDWVKGHGYKKPMYGRRLRLERISSSQSQSKQDYT